MEPGSPSAAQPTQEKQEKQEKQQQQQQLNGPSAGAPSPAQPSANDAAGSTGQQQQQQQQQDQQQQQRQPQPQPQPQPQQPSSAAPAELSTKDAAEERVQLELRVSHVSRQDLAKLEALLTQWATWHKQSCAQGRGAEVQLLRGSLTLDVEELYASGVASWVDRLAPVPGTGLPGGQAAAILYEQVEAPPVYERASCELLGPSAAPGAQSLLLPGGAFDARRRQMAEAREPPDAAGSDAAPAKRRRLPNQRCFNCGSYAHGVTGCSKPYDVVRVAAAKAEAAAERGGPGAGHFMATFRQRYFAAGGDKDGAAGDGPFAGLRAGTVSAELAAALGMSGPLAPPPWLSRMAALCVPPLYSAARQRASRPAADEAMRFILGSDDEQDEGPQKRQPDGAAAGVNGSSAAAGVHGARAASPPEEDAAHLPGVNAGVPDGADAELWQAEIDKAAALRSRIVAA